MNRSKLSEVLSLGRDEGDLSESESDAIINASINANTEMELMIKIICYLIEDKHSGFSVEFDMG